MSIKRQSFASLFRLLALCATALAACGAPAAPNDFPTRPVTPTALPPTTTPIAPTAALAATNTHANPGPVSALFFKLESLSGLAIDAAGNLYVAQCDITPKIFRIDRVGLLTTFAGTGDPGFAGDGGPAIAAQFDCSSGLALDRAGNLYVADWNNNRIRRIDTDGIITTVAGSGLPGSGDFAGDGGPATSAHLNHPAGIAVDNEGNLYIGDAVNNRVRKVDRQGIITSVAGNGTRGFAGDGGPANEAQFNTALLACNLCMAVTVDAAGNLYIADNGNYRIRKVDKQGTITTIAGNGQPGSMGDGGPATAAGLTYPTGLALDGQGNPYFSEIPVPGFESNRVRKVDQAGIITTVAGKGDRGYAVDGGLATLAALWGPSAIAFDPAGNLYIADFGNSRVRKVDRNGIITTVAGGRP